MASSSLGIDIAERTVSRLMPKRRPGPSQTWRTFLANHIRDLVSIDFLTVPTARLGILFVLVVLAHGRRRVVHFNVTEHPTAQWTARQIVEAFPDESALAYLLRDRDRVYGQPFRHRVKGMAIEEVLTAPESPWQNPFANGSSAGSGASASITCSSSRATPPPPHPDPLPRLLPSNAYSSRTRQGRTPPQVDPAPRDREDRGSFPKSAACTIATSAKPRSSASSVFSALERVTDPRVACSLSISHRESAGVVHGRRSENDGRPVRIRLSAVARGCRMIASKSDKLLAKDRFRDSARLGSISETTS
jgi:hypothetical protein